MMLGTPANGGMVYIAHRVSSHHVSISERLGTWRPMYCSALGMAYLSAFRTDTLDVERAPRLRGRDCESGKGPAGAARPP